MGRGKKERKNEYRYIVQIQEFTKSEMIDIHEEAYYRALKRMEKEKNKESERKAEERKDKWYDILLFALNFLFFPWKETRFMRIRSNAYDSLLIVIVSFMLNLIGFCLWFVGLFGMGYGIALMALKRLTNTIVTEILMSILGVVLGSIFIISGKEFGKEKDSNRIYAYSGCIIALVSCIISLVALSK